MPLLNRLGKRSVEPGLGPAYFHNHQPEFTIRFMDNGVLKSGWEIIMERTDPRWVLAQIDIGWAVCGAAGAASGNGAVGEAYVTNMINRFEQPDRVLPCQGHGRPAPVLRQQRPAQLGVGELNFVPMFAAAARPREVLLRRA